METKSINRTKILFTLAVLLLGLAGCETHVTPNKVERKLKDERWEVASFYYVDTNVTDLFAGDVFSFEEDGTIVIEGQWTFTGTWSVGLNNNPTILYIGNFSLEPYAMMNDDWIVETISNDQMTLKDDYGINELVFILADD